MNNLNYDIINYILNIRTNDLELDVVNKDTDKHEIVKYDMKKVIKQLKKNNKGEKIEERFFDKFKKKPIDHSKYSKAIEITIDSKIRNQARFCSLIIHGKQVDQGWYKKNSGFEA